MRGILGKKVGMTQVYDDQGNRVPVTLIDVRGCEVVSVRASSKTGAAVFQLGVGAVKAKGKNRPKKRYVREVHYNDGIERKAGDAVGAGLFGKDDFVDVSGLTKGKGFQGGVKRWGWRGGEKSHGSMFHRRIGSIGASSYPSRVHKGKTMPGHMGHVRRTVQNLRVVSVDEEKGLLAVKGCVPGHNNCFLMIREALKKPKKVESHDGKKK